MTFIDLYREDGYRIVVTLDTISKHPPFNYIAYTIPAKDLDTLKTKLEIELKKNHKDLHIRDMEEIGLEKLLTNNHGSLD